MQAGFDPGRAELATGDVCRPLSSRFVAGLHSETAWDLTTGRAGGKVDTA